MNGTCPLRKQKHQLLEAALPLNINPEKQLYEEASGDHSLWSLDQHHRIITFVKYQNPP